jgi:hypothetical protein
MSVIGHIIFGLIVRPLRQISVAWPRSGGVDYYLHTGDGRRMARRPDWALAELVYRRAPREFSDVRRRRDDSVLSVPICLANSPWCKSREAALRARRNHLGGHHLPPQLYRSSSRRAFGQTIPAPPHASCATGCQPRVASGFTALALLD